MSERIWLSWRGSLSFAHTPIPQVHRSITRQQKSCFFQLLLGEQTVAQKRDGRENVGELNGKQYTSRGFHLDRRKLLKQQAVQSCCDGKSLPPQVYITCSCRKNAKCSKEDPGNIEDLNYWAKECSGHNLGMWFSGQT